VIDSDEDDHLNLLLNWLMIITDQLLSLFIFQKVQREIVDKFIGEIEKFSCCLQEKVMCIEMLKSISSKIKLISSKSVNYYASDLNKDLIIEHIKI